MLVWGKNRCWDGGAESRSRLAVSAVVIERRQEDFEKKDGGHRTPIKGRRNVTASIPCQYKFYSGNCIDDRSITNVSKQCLYF